MLVARVTKARVVTRIDVTTPVLECGCSTWSANNLFQPALARILTFVDDLTRECSALVSNISFLQADAVACSRTQQSQPPKSVAAR
jgi:hypothetical protein